jgi:hypothetical protein
VDFCPFRQSADASLGFFRSRSGVLHRLREIRWGN